MSAAKQAIKFDFPDLFQQTKPSSQDNLTPLTQSYFANLPKQQTLQYPQVQGFKAADLPPITQNVQAQSWKTLSPSVEIFKSGGSGNYQPNPQQVYQQSQQFDHKGALGQSLGFDYSNAIDFGNGNGQRDTPQHGSSGPVLFDGKQQPQQQQHNFGVPAIHGFQDQSYFQFPQLQTSASDPEEQVVGNSKQYQGKLPVDTRLLRNPVLITDGTSLNQEQDVVPIRYDTHLLKEALNQQPIQQPPLQQQQQTDYFGGNDGFHALSGQTFKHYGKPQQDNLLGGYKDKGQDYLLRQPRVGPKKRSEVGLETHLRPPPISGEYQIKPFNSKI